MTNRGLDDATRWWIVGRLEAVQSQAICSRNLQVLRNVASTLWKQLRERRTVVSQPGQGGKRSTMLAQEFLRVLAKSDRSARATQLSYHLYNVTSIHRSISTSRSITSISQITVTQRLNPGGLYASHPVVCISLTMNHKKDCLACQDHLSLTGDDWRQAPFSHEF
ncbi:HTH_Tnp_Tc3_2 domain-containing protein [Trichonephila clavipes]|nr:HTH_Tnp_Tc3_2 domain-containing protein [Trichonephila clavipes]